MLVSVSAIALFSGFAFQSIYPGDAGDLVTASYQAGVPHPPGYPLYTLLGWLVTRLPFSTPAWRMAWLSIIPHAIAIAVVYLLVYRFTRRHTASLAAALVLVGNYVFFLYSITPEVFALLDVFILLIVYLAITLYERFDWRKVYLLFFVIGLSFSHHHMIIFVLLPLFLYLRGTFRSRLWSIKNTIAGVSAFFLGLIPYTYVALAAWGDAMVNWDRATTFARFWQLITRADYGTFVTGGVIGRSIYERFLNVQAYGTFLVIDFTWAGIVLACIGVMWLWQKNRSIAMFFILSFLFLGPGFMFYASFSAINRFVLGTYERFLLPSYMFVAMFVGVGVYAAAQWLSKLISFVFTRRSHVRMFSYLCMIVFLIYPLVTGSMTVWRFWGSRTDQTSDLFLKDLLDSAPKGAIILLSHDTPLFGAQYMRYAKGYRPDTTVLHTARLMLADYQEVIVRTNPDIIIPDEPQDSFVNAFMTANAGNRPIAVNTIIPTQEGWVWVPRGLLFVLMKKEAVPQSSFLVEQNSALWASFHDPTVGLLSRYNHLMLSNIRDEYATAAVSYGKTLIQADNLPEAERFFKLATRLESDTQRESAWTYLGLSQLFLKKCEDALVSFAKSRASALSSDPELYRYEAITYRDCVGDSDRANALYRQYEREKNKHEQPLEEL